MKTDRISKIINHLRTFSRQADDVLKEISVHNVIRTALDFMKGQIKAKNINLELNLCDSDPQIMADEIKFEQIIVNLFTNARDAIEEHHKDKINGNFKIKTIENDNNIEIIFEDNGMGMADKTKEKLYDAFYTTKEVGKGTGLGMSIIYGIVHEFKGSIDVESEQGVGTKFILTFPRINVQ